MKRNKEKYSHFHRSGLLGLSLFGVLVYVSYGGPKELHKSDEIIESFIEQGYQKNEAVAIFNYMIGEEELTEKQAKDRVNDDIKEVKQEERTEEEEERTPWGDAEARDARR